MASLAATAAAAPFVASRTLTRHAQQPKQQRASLARTQQRRCLRVAAEEGNGAATASSPVIGAPQQQHVIRMVNVVHEYFDQLLTQGDMTLLAKILDPSISHKDMVRNIGRVGMKEYETYLIDLHKKWPEYFVRPMNWGFVDNKSMFASFEGRVSSNTPKFYGVDLFIFNDDATKIKEVQVYRSNWLGAQGHEERKKLSEASARVEASQAVQRGQMP